MKCCLSSLHIQSTQNKWNEERGMESDSTCPGLQSVTFGITDPCRGAKEPQQILDSGNSANFIMPAINKSDGIEQIPTL